MANPIPSPRRLLSVAPESPRAGIIFFWDYDTQWGGDRSRAGAGPKDWGHLEFANTERLLELHAAYDIPACFAAVGAAALPGKRPYHDPVQIRRIHEAGHEVASHSFRHDWLPGLNRAKLLATLSDSKDAIEQTIGAAVTTFVPPYNQPYDYARGLSFSLSERREAGRERTDLATLCDALYEVGYRVCRVSYRGLHLRLAAAVMRHPVYGPAGPIRIGNIQCIRLNAGCGFDQRVVHRLRKCVRASKLMIVYGHPHSLSGGGEQDEKHLIPFLEETIKWRNAGKLQVTLPSELVIKPLISSVVRETGQS